MRHTSVKRWLLLTEFFPPEQGGIQRALTDILRDLGGHATVITRPQEGAEQFDRTQSYKVIRRSLFGGRSKPSWLWLVGWLSKHRHEVDLAVYGHFSAAVTASWLLSWFGHHYAILIHGNDLLSEQQRAGHQWLIRSVLRRANWIGVNSAFTAEAVTKCGVPRVRIIRSHPAVKDELLKIQSNPEEAQIITICRLVPRKNVAQIIRAMPEILKALPNAHYDIVGDGPERAGVEALVQELGLFDSVHVHGEVSDPVKLSLLKRATLFAMVPKVLKQGSDVEGLGIVYLEAAALGLPIVASQTGGIPDIVHHHQNGLFVGDHPKEIAQAILSLLRDPALRSKFGQYAQELVSKEFTLSVRNGRLAWLLNGAHPIPKVSIVIPVFNHANTIGETLRSIFDQTWADYEVIVVDDGSTDNLATAIQPWREKITFVSQSNQGAPVARNLGANEAHGEFLLFVDADTWLDPSMIEQMVTALALHPEASFVYSRHRFGIKSFRFHEYSEAKLRRRNFIHTSSLLRRVDFPGFDESLKRFQDWDMWLTFAKAGKRGIWIPDELFRVSQGKGGMKASTWIPRFMYRLPLIGRGVGNRTIQKYRAAEEVIRQKHGLN